MDKNKNETSSLIRGKVLTVTFYNPENGFCVLKTECNSENKDEVFYTDRKEKTSIIGEALEKIAVGASIIARGVWENHSKFGKQFKAYSITQVQPTDKEAIISYLGSGLIRGLGPVLAQKIVDYFGEKTLDILNATPHLLKEVPGIGKKKSKALIESWNSQKDFREVSLFLQSHNISVAMAQRIYRNYGNRTIEKIHENPYILAKDIYGIGFLTADNTAASLGIEPDSPFRIRAGLNYILAKSIDDGHIYLLKQILISKTASLLRLNDEAKILAELQRAFDEGELVIVAEEEVYLPAYYRIEGQLAEAIATFVNCDKPKIIIPDRYVVDVLTSGALNENNQEQKIIHLSQEQEEAIKLIAKHSLVVITGGPGCGKTTIIKTITKLFQKAGLNFKLAAPTGKASQRMSEVCDLEASTIHRLLKYDPIKKTFLFDKDTQLPIDAIIIDESSMIDINLANSLFQAIPTGARVVVVGDADQLPSVGPGVFLSDLLAINKVQRLRLTQLFRRSEESSITSIAYQINNAEIPEIPQPDGKTKSDSYFLPCENQNDAVRLIEKLVANQIPKKFGFSVHDITVLSPMNQGELGIIALNKVLQNKIIPVDEFSPRVKVGNLELRIGDRVIQRVNNYQITENGVFNGDLGKIDGIDAENNSVYVKFWDGRVVEYQQDVLHQLDLAYALTVHRSQGSEMPVVVLVLHEMHGILLERQLIYTAVTRAKKLLIVVGTKRAMILAIKKTRSRRRFSGLVKRVGEFLK
ncbi:MAG: ATP-dependent RecD-like DNA helicase [Deltaproteobacteria bacterium]|jgi:exodeoxyribonuclease V alpha subunit|nr:ATP-dependent RecD-like DNA helicase [Deltaproteobacteria bacterium]